MDVQLEKQRVNYACLGCLDTEFISYLIITKNLIDIFKRRGMIQFFKGRLILKLCAGQNENGKK